MERGVCLDYRAAPRETHRSSTRGVKEGGQEEGSESTDPVRSNVGTGFLSVYGSEGSETPKENT